jgi:hypothetical protein
MKMLIAIYNGDGYRALIAWEITIANNPAGLRYGMGD